MKLTKFSDIKFKLKPQPISCPPSEKVKDITYTPQPSGLSNDNVAEVVIASKTVHKGAFIGHVSNGNGQIPLSDIFSIRFVALNNDFTKIEIKAHGSTPKYQSWQKVKTVKEEKPKAPEIKSQGSVTL